MSQRLSNRLATIMFRTGHPVHQTMSNSRYQYKRLTSNGSSSSSSSYKRRTSTNGRRVHLSDFDRV